MKPTAANRNTLPRQNVGTTTMLDATSSDPQMSPHRNILHSRRVARRTISQTRLTAILGEALAIVDDFDMDEFAAAC